MPTNTFLDDNGDQYRDFPSGRLYDLDANHFLIRPTYRPTLGWELVEMGVVESCPDRDSYVVRRIDYARILECLRYRPRLSKIPAKYRSGYRFRHVKPTLG